jgi:hypothetical protein
MGSRGLAAVGVILSAMVLLIMAILPALAEGLPAECAARDAAVAEQVRTLMSRDDAQAVGQLHYTLSSLKMARGLCLGQQPAQAERVYRQIDTVLSSGGQTIAEQPRIEQISVLEF